MAMVITDNSPGAGSIAWTGVTIEYKGTTYTIANGNSAMKFLWWDFDSPTALQESDTLPTLVDDDGDIIVFLNLSGTHYIVPTMTKIQASLITGTLIEFINTPSEAPDADYEVSNKKYVDDNSQSADGWISAAAFTYNAANEITVASGAAAIYQVGDKIKFTQATGGTKYGYITIVADTLLTVNLGGLYTLENEAITAPYYSHQNSPLGFPIKMIPGYVKARAYQASAQLNVPASAFEIICLDTDSFDTGGDFVHNSQAYTNDPGAGSNIQLDMVDTSYFQVGDPIIVKSSAGFEGAYVTVVDPNVSITVDALVLNHTTTTPTVEINYFLAPVTGFYDTNLNIRWTTFSGYTYKVAAFVDPLGVGSPAERISTSGYTGAGYEVGLPVSDILSLNKGDRVYLYWYSALATSDVDPDAAHTYMSLSLKSVI